MSSSARPGSSSRLPPIMELTKGPSSVMAPKICVVNVPYGQQNGGGVGDANGGAVVSSVAGIVQTAVVTTPASATDTLSMLPTVPVPQQTHITVAPTPTAPTTLGKVRYASTVCNPDDNQLYITTSASFLHMNCIFFNFLSSSKVVSNGVPTHINIPGMPNTSITSVPSPSSTSSSSAAVSLVNRGGSGNSGNGGGGAKCLAPVVTSSLKELRMKGSAFLRTHASKHGITNASRKLTAAVITELTQHYIEAHGVKMDAQDSGHVGGEAGVVGGGGEAKEEPESSSASELCPIGVAQILQSMRQARPVHQMQVQPPPQQLPPPPPARPPPAHNAPASAPAPVVPCLPQYPVPKQLINGHPQAQQTTQQVHQEVHQQVQQQVQQQHLHLLQQGQQQHHAQGAVTIKKIPTQPATIATKLHESQVLPEVTVSPVMVAASSSTSPTSALGGGGCAAPILAKTRVELNACGTSLLRPEAAAHKVHNASRKPKDKVVEELWQHYVQCHQHDLRSKAPLPKRALPPSTAPTSAVAAAAASTASSRPYPVVNGGRKIAAGMTAAATALVAAPMETNGVVKTVIEASGRAGPPVKMAANASVVVSGNWVGVVNDEEDN